MSRAREPWHRHTLRPQPFPNESGMTHSPHTARTTRAQSSPQRSFVPFAQTHPPSPLSRLKTRTLSRSQSRALQKHPFNPSAADISLPHAHRNPPLPPLPQPTPAKVHGKTPRKTSRTFQPYPPGPRNVLRLPHNHGFFPVLQPT